MSSRALTLALCVAVFLGSAAVTAAQIAGGRAGSAIAPEPADSGGRAIAVQADGAIVLAGPQGRGAQHRYRVAVVRFTPEGQLDTTFNGRGFVTTEIGQVSDFVRGVAIQSDGKIVVAAATKMADHSEVFSLARFTPDGRLDPGFGDDGKVLTQLSSVKIRLTMMGGLALQPDGKILVVGSVLTRQWWPIPDLRYEFTVARYLTDGRMDRSFGRRGAAVHTVGDDSDDFAGVVTPQVDGKILVGGSAGGDIALLRLNADGSRDRDFGDGGKVIVQSKNSSSASSVAMQADGKILVSAHRLLLRYLTNGRPDPDFGEAGIVTTPFGERIIVQPGGKILLASVRGIARYLPDGRLDPSFGRAGIVSLDAGRGLRMLDPALQPDGKILLGGSNRGGDKSRFAVTRYNPDGSLDTTFGDPP